MISLRCPVVVASGVMINPVSESTVRAAIALLDVIGTLNRSSNHADAKRFRCSFNEA